MTQSGFKKATKAQSRLRMAFIGPAGSGKTYSALSIACHLGQRVAVIDTERGSASKYADKFDFDVLELDSFDPDNYVSAIKLAEKAAYEVIVIDSLSHAWIGKGGALEQVDMATRRGGGGNSFNAWRTVTPKHNAFVDAILGCSAHVITTLRAKTEYVQEKDERTGKTIVRKVGLAPVQRDGLEYEFDVTGDMDPENNFIVSKTRCSDLAGKVFSKPGETLASILKTWLSDGAPVAKTPATLPAVSIEPGPLPDVDAALQAALAADFIRMIGEAETSEKVLDVLENVHKASLPQSYLPPINEAVSKHFVRRIGNAATKSELDDLRAHIKNANLPGPFVATVRSTYAQRSKLLSGAEAAA